MKMMPILLTLAATLTTLSGADATLPHVKAELTYAPNVPPPITRHEPAIVDVDLTATHKMSPLSSSSDYHFWTFNDHVPGPFIRARIGDWLQVHISNTDTSGMPHNLDFHAATGPGGGMKIQVVRHATGVGIGDVYLKPVTYPRTDERPRHMVVKCPEVIIGRRRQGHHLVSCG